MGMNISQRYIFVECGLCNLQSFSARPRGQGCSPNPSLVRALRAANTIPYTESGSLWFVSFEPDRNNLDERLT